MSRKAKPTSAAATGTRTPPRAPSPWRLGAAPPRRARRAASPAAGSARARLAGRQRHQQVEQRRDPHRLADTQRLQGEEGGEQGPQDGAQGVDGVEQAHHPAAGVGAALDGAGRRRQRAPHQEGRHSQHQRREQEAHGAAPREPQPGAPPHRHVEPLDQRQQPGREAGGDGDPRLQGGVEGERRGLAVGPPPQQQAAEAQPGHEQGEHRGRGRRRGAEDQAEHPQPRRLVDQGAEAGRKEQQRHSPAAERMGSPPSGGNAGGQLIRVWE